MNQVRLQRTAIYSMIAVAASVVTLLAVRARAAGIPDAAALTYTGYLEEPDGTPVTTTKGIGISLYAAETGGKEVCDVKPADIVPVSGRFQIPLPDDCADAVKANPDLWAEVLVEGSLLGRTKLGAVPYAIEASHAVTADSLVTGQSGFHATLSKNQSIEGNTLVTVKFDTAQFDLGGEFDLKAATFTPKVSGFYFVQCSITFEQSTFGTVAYWRTAISVDGVEVAMSGGATDGQTVSRTASGVLKVEADSVVTCVASQNGQAAHSVRRDVEGSHFEATRLSIHE